MYNKYYIVEWIINLDNEYCFDRKRFKADEGEQMAQFIFSLAHEEGISKIWKSTFEEITF